MAETWAVFSMLFIGSPYSGNAFPKKEKIRIMNKCFEQGNKMIFVSPAAFNSDLTFHQDNDVHLTVDFIPRETDGNDEARISLQVSESFIFWS